ncbi:MAG: serine/threonine protein kinase, partial [Nannocystaceae bacterium]|nr:serine/threonine protein kinase [Nannocystaceae bacterium]
MQHQRAQPSAPLIVPIEPEFGDRFENGSVVPGTRYRVRELIGDGGMGQVYAAEHMDLERTVAMKVLLPALCRAPEALAMFRREARTASKLGAEQIVEVYDFAELPDGRLMFAMELLDGPTLADLLEEGPLSAPRVTAILRQVCKGLAAAHKAGVVHRDIKPENIVLVKNREGRPDTVKILDFGISTILDDKQSDSAVSAGTPYYLAPEFIAGHEFDGRMDQYALGCTAYELLSGKPPFLAGEGEGVAEILSNHLDEAPARLSKRAVGVQVPAGLERVVLRCLAKDPAERYADMHALEAALCEAQIDAKLMTSWDDLPLPQDIDPELRDRLLRKMPDPHAPPSHGARNLLYGALAVGLGAGAMYYWMPRAVSGGDQAPGIDAAAVAAPEVTRVETIVADARTAAARSLFVVPSPDDEARLTAYRKVRELEDIAGPDKTTAQKQALLLRGEFAATLVRLGDQYWAREGGTEFAVDYYRQALVFQRDQPTASERAGLDPQQLAEFEAKAATAEFTEQELLDAVPLVALAEPDDDKRRRKIKALRTRRKANRGATANRATDRLLAVGERPATETTTAAEAAQNAGTQGANDLARTARSALASGKLKQARMFFDRALTFDVDNRAALAGLFDLEFRGGNYRAAVGFAQRLVTAHL